MNCVEMRNDSQLWTLTIKTKINPCTLIPLVHWNTNVRPYEIIRNHENSKENNFCNKIICLKRRIRWKLSIQKYSIRKNENIIVKNEINKSKRIGLCSLAPLVHKNTNIPTFENIRIPHKICLSAKWFD